MIGVGKRLLVFVFVVFVLSACEFTVKDPGGLITRNANVHESVYLNYYDYALNVFQPQEMDSQDGLTYSLKNINNFIYMGFISDGTVSWMPEYEAIDSSSGSNEQYTITLTDDPTLWGKPTIPAVDAQIKGIEHKGDDTFTVTLAVYGEHGVPVDGRTHVYALSLSGSDTNVMEEDVNPKNPDQPVFNGAADTVTENGDALFTMIDNNRNHSGLADFQVYSDFKMLNTFRLHTPKPAFEINGDEDGQPVETAQATVNVLEGSGIVQDTLKYAWSTSAATPDSAAFQPFKSGDRLTKSNATGDWYLHVEADHIDKYKARKVSEPFKLTAPTDPGEETPTDPGEETPTDPGEETPTDPGAETPTDPGEETSTSPGGQAPYSGSANIGSPTEEPSAAAASVERTVGGSQSTTVELTDIVSINVPAGALSNERMLTIAVVPGDSAPPLEGREALSEVIDLTLDNGERSFNRPLTLTFHYDAGKLAHGQRPSVYYFNEKQHRWVYVGGTAHADGTISVSIDHFTNFTVFAEKPLPEFADLKDHWSKPYTERLVGMGVIAGFEDGLFRPNEKVTRAQFARMLSLTLGLKAEKTKTFFMDDSAIGEWAKASVAAAAEAGLISGYDEAGGKTFRPDQTVTRAEIAAMLGRALEVKGQAQELAFTDGASIPQWAREAVAYMAQHGLVKGFVDGTFRPGDSATRAEAVSMLYALLDQLNL